MDPTASKSRRPLNPVFVGSAKLDEMIGKLRNQLSSSVLEQTQSRFRPPFQTFTPNIPRTRSEYYQRVADLKRGADKGLPESWKDYTAWAKKITDGRVKKLEENLTAAEPKLVRDAKQSRAFSEKRERKKTIQGPVRFGTNLENRSVAVGKECLRPISIPKNYKRVSSKSKTVILPTSLKVDLMSRVNSKQQHSSCFGPPGPSSNMSFVVIKSSKERYRDPDAPRSKTVTKKQRVTRRLGEEDIRKLIDF